MLVLQWRCVQWKVAIHLINYNFLPLRVPLLLMERGWRDYNPLPVHRLLRCIASTTQPWSVDSVKQHLFAADIRSVSATVCFLRVSFLPLHCSAFPTSIRFPTPPALCISQFQEYDSLSKHRIRICFAATTTSYIFGNWKPKCLFRVVHSVGIDSL